MASSGQLSGGPRLYFHGPRRFASPLMAPDTHTTARTQGIESHLLLGPPLALGGVARSLPAGLALFPDRVGARLSRRPDAAAREGRCKPAQDDPCGPRYPVRYISDPSVDPLSKRAAILTSHAIDSLGEGGFVGLTHWTDPDRH